MTIRPQVRPGTGGYAPVVRTTARRTLAALGLVVCLVALVPAIAGGTASPSLQGVNFISVCAFSHRAPDDPIVFPRQPGMSHDHTFVGNSSTDAFSTPASLHASGTTCTRKGDTAAYWMPTLYADGQPVLPKQAVAYYRRTTTAALKPFPQGLQMVAGNSHATAPQNVRVVYWDCGDFSEVQRSSAIPACPDASTLSLHVRFPNCWDGKNLRSATQSHVAYSTGVRCPRGYPVAMPALELVFHYPIAGSGHQLALASGGQDTGHADFVNSWDQPTLTRLVSSCLNRFRHCGTGS